MRRVQTIPEQIVDQLRKDILAGILQEGTPLREQELSERFGVSRGPVRAALQQLAAEGLVVAVPNVGVRVAPYPREEVFPVIIQMRQLIEECILSLICEQLSADLIHHLEEVLEKLRTACDQADMPAVQALDRAFHSTLVESYGEQRLVTIWNALYTWMNFRESPQHDLRKSYQAHKAILEAIKNGDQENAIQLVKINIQES